MKLNIRQQKVLKATVRHYVSTAEPVGSKSLASGYDLSVSSATIRSVMSALEDSGLLYQPHTSAGRIPSDSGYRAYVNELMEPSQPLTLQMENTISQRMGSQRMGSQRIGSQRLGSQRIGGQRRGGLEGQRAELDSPLIVSLLQESAQVIASLSGYVALVTLPQVETAKIQHLQLVQVSDRQILLVVVLDVYSNHSILLPLPAAEASDGASKDLDIASELQILSNFLTHQLKGRSLQDAALDWSELDRAFARYASGLQQAIGDLSMRSRANPSTQILVSGLAEVLAQPEFSERSQIRSIVQLLEDGRDQLWPLISTTSPLSTISQLETDLLPKDSTRNRLRIWIGDENPVEPMRSCALVTATYGESPGPLGSLGVLGPTRMLYENAIAAVEAAANYLTDAVATTLDIDNRLTPEG